MGNLFYAFTDEFPTFLRRVLCSIWDKGSRRSGTALEGYFQIRKLKTFTKVTCWLLK
jgi:hypothetical protein